MRFELPQFAPVKRRNRYEGLELHIPSFDSTDERPVVRLAVQCVGCSICLVILVWSFGLLFSLQGVSLRNSTPQYVRSWLFLSTAQQLEVFGTTRFPPPPPPQI